MLICRHFISNFTLNFIPVKFVSERFGKWGAQDIISKIPLFSFDLRQCLYNLGFCFWLLFKKKNKICLIIWQPEGNACICTIKWYYSFRTVYLILTPAILHPKHPQLIIDSPQLEQCNFHPFFSKTLFVRFQTFKARLVIILFILNTLYNTVFILLLMFNLCDVLPSVVVSNYNSGFITDTQILSPAKRSLHLTVVNGCHLKIYRMVPNFCPVCTYNDIKFMVC